MILIIMGVSGAGKTTVGKAISEKLSYQFHDADDFHPNVNKQKMAAGIPLTDEDRLPWLNVLKEKIKRWDDLKMNSVLACSALKRSYRYHLISGLKHDLKMCGKDACFNKGSCDEDTSFCSKNIVYIYLTGTIEFISDRMSKRVGHFMPLKLLQSQFQDLEEPQKPENFISIDVRKGVGELVDEIINKMFKIFQY